MFQLVVLQPVVLTDEIFANYGGDTGSVSYETRQAAFAIAETMAQQQTSCFLSPTIVSGTYNISRDGSYQLPFAPVTEVMSVRFWDTTSTCSKIYTDGCAEILGQESGLIRVSTGCRMCNTSTQTGRIDIVYKAGVNGQNIPNVRLGLSIAATKILEQIIDPDAALGGAGDPEVTSFSDTGLSLSFGASIVSKFGGSPEMQLATRLIQTGLPRRRVFRLK